MTYIIIKQYKNICTYYLKKNHSSGKIVINLDSIILLLGIIILALVFYNSVLVTQLKLLM